jgi:hypothetical protein
MAEFTCEIGACIEASTPLEAARQLNAMILAGAIETASVRHGDGGDIVYVANLNDGSVALEEGPSDDAEFSERHPDSAYGRSNPLGGLFAAAKSALTDLEGIVPELAPDSDRTRSVLETIAALKCSVAAVIGGMNPEQAEEPSTESRGRRM